MPRSDVGSALARKQPRRRWRKDEGQQATAAGLDLLRVLGWLVLHDAVVPGEHEGTIDHLLAGPSGVYVVNSVCWSGAITMTDQALVVDRTDRADALAEVAAAAEALRTVLGGIPVLPVLCFERLEDVAGLVRDVALLSSENILGALTAQPGILDRDALARVSRSIADQCLPQRRKPEERSVGPVALDVAPLSEMAAQSAESAVTALRDLEADIVDVDVEVVLAEAEAWQRETEEVLSREREESATHRTVAALAGPRRPGAHRRDVDAVQSSGQSPDTVAEPSIGRHRH